jgi:hypothetical protein
MAADFYSSLNTVKQVLALGFKPAWVELYAREIAP